MNYMQYNKYCIILKVRLGKTLFCQICPQLFTILTYIITKSYKDDNYVYLSIQINFFIIYFTVFTVFFKKMITTPFTSAIVRGVCQNLFFFGRTPPLPHRTAHIAPFLNYHHSYYAAKPKEPRCPPPVLYNGHYMRNQIFHILQ